MSSLWTPSGERPVGRDEPESTAPTAAEPTANGPAAPTDDDLSEEEVRVQMAAVQQELLSVPASVVVANHCIGLFQLAALHLEQRPPNLAEAAVAIDAMAGMVEALGSRLGEEERPLRDAVASIQMGFVQVKSAVEQGGAPPA